MTDAKPILAIVVLYRMSFSASPTYRTLCSALAEAPGIGRSINLLVADNSPEAQAPPRDFRGRYFHDGENAGLARRYNYALDLAQAEGAEWLLLLDQDTELTLTYLQELLALSRELAPRTEIAAIVPKLVKNGAIKSPQPPAFLRPKIKIDLDTTGVLANPLRPFNSAALLRVSRLQDIGGFPVEYWLDFLDHATFATLQEAGGRIYVMRSALFHDLAEPLPGIDTERTLSIMASEYRFLAEHGTRRERLWHAVDLVRQVIGHGRRGRFKVAGRRLRILLRRPVGLN